VGFVVLVLTVVAYLFYMFCCLKVSDVSVVGVIYDVDCGVLSFSCAFISCGLVVFWLLTHVCLLKLTFRDGCVRGQLG